VSPFSRRLASLTFLNCAWRRIVLHWNRQVRHFLRLIHIAPGASSRRLRPILPLIALVSWPGELSQLSHLVILKPTGAMQTPATHIYGVDDPFDPDVFPELDQERPYPNESQILSVRSALRLPDLRTLPPSGVQIEVAKDGSRALRLSNTLWNSGDGPLELAGEFDFRARQTRVRQHIYTHGDLTLEHFVGEFVWHPTHDHWHFEDFTLYELWTIDGVGNKLRVISSSDKLSYCVIDTDTIDPNNPAYLPRKRYAGCGRSLQGLSAGWGDTYKANLDGQSLDLTGLPDGYYMLMSTTNPTAAVLESNYTNNTASLYIQIRGQQVDVIPANELSEALCLKNGKC